jgi:hypothetical protein
MTWRLRESCRAATRLGFADIIVIAIVMAILLFASWKQFPAYNRPFTPRAIRTPVPRVPTPGHTALRFGSSDHFEIWIFIFPAAERPAAKKLIARLNALC